jgi:hypothetical protein
MRTCNLCSFLWIGSSLTVLPPTIYTSLKSLLVLSITVPSHLLVLGSTSPSISTSLSFTSLAMDQYTLFAVHVLALICDLVYMKAASCRVCMNSGFSLTVRLSLYLLYIKSKQLLLFECSILRE